MMQFHKPNDETLNQDFSKDKREVAEQGGVKAFYLQPGVTNLRILPPFNERGVWYRELYEYNVVVDGQRRVFSAPSQFGNPDPFEEKRQQLLSLGGEANIKAAESLKPTRRFLFNALIWVAPPGVEVTRGEVVVLKAPVTVKRHLLEMDRDVQGGWADITNPSNGVNLKISRTGKGLNTEYSVSPMPHRSDIAQDLAQVQVDLNTLNLYNLDELYQPLPYEELKKVVAKIGAVTVSAPQPVAVPTPPPVPVAPVQVTAPVPVVPQAPEAFVPGMNIPPPPPPIK
jgi:hypothetical protein